MKTTNFFRAIAFIAIISILGGSCIHIEADLNVRSCFTSPNLVDAGEEINFENCSQSADHYVWDFGDGNQSEDYEPIFYYETPGKYTVTLTAYSRNERKLDVSTKRIEVLPATELSIRVLFNGTTVPVNNCSVRLYTSQNDWDKETNILIEGFTDSDGIIGFTYLYPIKYYMDAFKKDASGKGFYSNWDLGYITDPLEPNKVNYYDIFVEYKANTTKTKTLQLVNAVKTTAETHKSNVVFVSSKSTK